MTSYVRALQAANELQRQGLSFRDYKTRIVNGALSLSESRPDFESVERVAALALALLMDVDVAEQMDPLTGDEAA